MMKEPLKVAFADTFENAQKFWVWLLSHRYDVTVEDRRNMLFQPDLLIFGDGNFGKEHRDPVYTHIKKLFYTGENVSAPWDECDFACTFEHVLNKKHYRLPLYVLETWAYWNDHGFPFDYLWVGKPNFPRSYFKQVTESKQGFCSFVQSNPNVNFRNGFFHLLDNYAKQWGYKQVDSGGPLFNNVGFMVNRPGGHIDKQDFISKYKFNIAMENGKTRGYVTEKLLNCFYANVVPIYWGSDWVHQDFNKDAFIDISDYLFTDGYGTEQLHLAAIEKIREYDEDKEKYIDLLMQPAYTNNEFPFNIEEFLNWFDLNLFKEIKNVKDSR